jgi:hypothetical protein
MEGAFEQISLRLSEISGRLDQMDARISRLEERVDVRISRLEEKVDRQFSWMVGLIVIAILVPIGLRFVPLP